jgi:integrase
MASMHDIPGTIYPHQKTGGYRWRLPGKCVPEAIAAGQTRVQIRLIPAGRSKPTTSRRVAEAIVRRLWKQWSMTPPQPEPGQAATLEAHLHGLAQWQAQQASPGVCRETANKIRRFLAASSASTPEQFTRRSVQNYLARLHQQGLAPRTLAKHRSALSVFARYLMQLDAGENLTLLGDNPAAQCRLPSPERLEPRYVSRSSIRILIGRLRRSRRPWLADAVRFAVHTGARLGTIRAYTYDEIPPQRASMAPIRSLKTRRICYVPINRPLARWFDSVREPDSHAQTVFPHHHSRSWQLWLGRVALDLPGFAEGTGTGRLWHALRSTFAVRMAARNPLTGRPATMWELMAMLGHQDPQTTLGYVNVARAAGLLRT